MKKVSNNAMLIIDSAFKSGVINEETYKEICRRYSR